MQPFDENMWELFRTASADIRLKSADDDWDKIQEGLLPGRNLLPSTETTGAGRKTDHKLKPAVFLFAITVMLALILVSQNTKKMEAGLQRVIHHTGENAKGPAIKKDRTVQNIKVAENLWSLIPVFVVNPFAGDHLKMKSLVEPASPEWKERIQVGANMKAKPSMSVYEFRQDSVHQKVITKQTAAQNKPVEEKWIYGGIIAGPQFSQTKQQGFGNAGLSGGLIAGFHLNKRLSVETGLVISNKEYYSSGKYFDMSKISASMPAGMKLMQIQSKTTVLEIPLEIRYNMASIGKGNLFAAGGFSSYIITREMNQYQVMVNGNNETLNGNYSTHQDYFAAAAKISAGYEWKAGKGLNLRLEPYLQIPLKTIGMGSMHVVSMGVYLGVTFPLIK